MQRSKYRRRLGERSGHSFAALVAELLSALLPNITESKHLGDLDRDGIDVYQFDDDFSVRLAVQCKGYEREWHATRIKELEKEIAKFIRKSAPVQEYWLVLNREIRDPKERRAIEASLTEAVASGKAKTTKLLDLNKFAKELASRAIAKFRQLSGKARERYSSTYRARMAAIDYLPDVPFLDGDQPRKNLTAHVISSLQTYAETIKPGTTGRYRNPPRFLITGSFGFGKTLGLHALGELRARAGQDVFFFPAANLSDRAFVNSAGLLMDVTAQIADDALASSDMAMAIVQDACRREFVTHHPLLLIDGIDESQFWHDSERLEMLWNSIEQLGIPVAVTVRDELYLSRPQEFTTHATPHFFQHNSLSDWDSGLMTEFLDRFALQRGEARPPTFKTFRDTVARGDYEDRYGDIPRRPLFLGMLAEDAWQGHNPEEQLYRLYGKYFRSKLERDWSSIAAPGRIVRAQAVASRYGREQAAEELIWMMQTLALNTHDWGASESSASSFREEQLRRTVSSTIGHVERIEEVLFTSLIQPAGRDPVSRRRLYRFAHQSFFDWFLARGLVEAGRTTELSALSPTAVSFGVAMAAAVDRGEALP